MTSMVMETIALHLTNGALTSQLILAPKEAYKLPRGCKSIRVIYGTAWLSFAGQDIILLAGEQIDLTDDSDDAVISPTRKTPLILELASQPIPN